MGGPLHDPFNRTRLPRSISREGRIALIAEAARAMLEGVPPSQEAALFLGAALLAWLEDGGRIGALERNHLRTAPPRSSTVTAGELWRRCSSRGATGGDDAGDHRQHHESEVVHDE